MIISNKSSITYNAETPDGVKSAATTESNTVNTEILSYSVPKSIRTDKTTVREGETAHSSVIITNNSATKLFNNYFTAPEPDGASYVIGSVKINGIAQPSYNPATGFALPDLNIGEAIVIEYDVKANTALTTPLTHFATLDYTVTDPVRGDAKYSERTDAVALEVIADRISVVKSVDKTFAVKGEKLHYTITITNTGNTTKSGMIFQDPIPVGTTFVPDSIKINGIGYSMYNPQNGFVIRSLSPAETTTVEFDVKVN